MRKILFLFIFTAILTHTHTAYASAVVTFDDSNVTINQNIGINIDCSVVDDVSHRLYWFTPSGVTTSDSSCNLGVPYYYDNWIIDGITSWLAAPNELGAYTVWYVPSPDEYPACITFDGSTNDLAACQIEFPTMYLVNTLTVSANGGIVSGNTTWGSNNGFWGSTTVSDVSTAMVGSVQATGLNIYPLLTFVGIPLAFLLAGFLVYLINKQLTPVTNEKKETINPNGTDFIYHSAQDLEFKREYGTEPIKRKRGRPRKVL